MPEAASAPGPLVSVVIDNYQYERFLPRAIESALAQTWTPREVIVVDDASTDGSRAVIDRYGAAIVPVLQRVNRGQGAAFNAGFAASRGEIVVFLDADDWMYPHAIERVVRAFRPGVAVVQWRLDLVDGRGTRIDTFPAPEIPFDTGDVVPLLLRQGRFASTVTSGNAFARKALSAAMPVPEQDFRQGADGYLLCVAPFHGEVATIDEVLGAYCQHGANHSDFCSALASRARWRVEHDEKRYRAIRGAARSRGLQPAADTGLNDHRHVESRLVSLVLDPARHPVPGDRRGHLGWKGAVSVASARLPRRRRALLAAWFAVVGFAPPSIARRGIELLLSPHRRGALLRRVVGGLRALTR